MNLMTIIITIIVTAIASIIAGLALPFIERAFLKRNDKSKAFEVDIPKNHITTKILTNEIIQALSPERNYDKAKELLGIPDKIIYDCCVFESVEHTDSITSDIYLLQNAALKVTTIDKQSIHALTVLFHDNKLLLPDLLHPCDMYNIHEDNYENAKVCQELVEESFIGSIRTMRDSTVALRLYMGPPFYKHMTYFIDGYLEDEENPNKSELIGSKIIGFCLSSSSRVFYLYDYELR